MENKVFIIFNTTSIGDVLVTNTLVQNIKLYYPESKVVFVCNTPMCEVAKYQAGVDDVVLFNKQSDKSLRAVVKFAKEFPYKKPYASFVTYSNERNLLISRLIGSKHVISHHKFKLWNCGVKYQLREYVHIKDKWGGMIEALTNEHKNLPIRYMPPNVDNEITRKIQELEKPVALSLTSNFVYKDMKVNDCKELIQLLNENGYTPVITGAGKVAADFNIELRKAGCFDFIDIVNCTSFVELANVLKLCGSCISVDTGTLHFANALQVPVVGIFYAGEAEKWGSDTNLYPAKILSGPQGILAKITSNEIVEAYKELMGVCG